MCDIARLYRLRPWEQNLAAPASMPVALAAVTVGASALGLRASRDVCSECGTEIAVATNRVEQSRHVDLLYARPRQSPFNVL
jgi:hypothetical protein